jgi:hypothetical protein
MLIKLCWVTAPSSQADVDRVMAYITANYTANSEVAERERAARIDEIRRTRPHLTYPGMVYYGERMNELRSDETEEI